MTATRSTKRRAPRCEVCTRPTQRYVLCALCGKSYDRDAHDDPTVMGAIVWAARRARYFARQQRPARKTGGARG